MNVASSIAKSNRAPYRNLAGAVAPVTEADASHDMVAGWHNVFGNFRGTGYRIKWHDFLTKREFDWATGFQPDCVGLCLNLDGKGFVEGRGGRAEFLPNTAGFFYRPKEPLTAGRAAGERHQFLTLEFSCPFLAKHLTEAKGMLHSVVRAAIDGCPCKQVIGQTVRLTVEQLQVISTLRRPPVHAAAQPLWYKCKALEMAAMFLVQPEEELFCTRQHRLAQERVGQVKFLLKLNLAEPPTLEELGRSIGCSHFYLSRVFSAQTGQTITQFLRQLRLEKAAELLKSGEYNVTEAALEVGYNSLSHFSAAFRETFGCCPGLYPLKTAAQNVR